MSNTQLDPVVFLGNVKSFLRSLECSKDGCQAAFSEIKDSLRCPRCRLLYEIEDLLAPGSAATVAERWPMYAARQQENDVERLAKMRQKARDRELQETQPAQTSEVCHVHPAPAGKLQRRRRIKAQGSKGAVARRPNAFSKRISRIS